MRTEEQLRSTLTTLADQPHAIEDVYASIMRRTAQRPVRRRRTALVLAIAAVAVIVAVVVPQFLVQRTVVPADQRVRGNWNLIHTIDLPPDWEVTDQVISARTETSTLHTPVGAGDDLTYACTVTIFGRDVLEPKTTGTSPVTVDGHDGYFIAGTAANDFTSGVFWPYADRAWANADCQPAGDSSRTTPSAEQQSLQIARRVHFAVTTSRLPFRLSSMPAGYQVQAVAPRIAASPETFRGGVQFSAADQNHPVPYLDIVLSTGRTEIPPNLPGWETDTIDGVPAVLSARDGKLCLNLRDHTLCITSEGGEPADLTKSLWPAGRRELLVSIAQDLTLAKKLDDPSAWFAANEALPQ